MTGRERLLLALENKKTDYIPCCFMIFTLLRKKCRDQFEFIRKQLELGLDIKVELPELPFRFHPEVKVKEWEEVDKETNSILLNKEYITPSGVLKTTVRKTEDWPYGNSVPLLNDYLTVRCKKFLIENEQDVKKLKFLFAEPTDEDIEEFRRKSKELKKFADGKFLLTGGWRSGSGGNAPEKGIDKDGGTMGADALLWLCGAENTIFLAMDKPELIQEILEIISAWNRKRIQIYLEEGIDLLIRRGWYEGTDIWSPSLFRKFIFPVLKEEIDIVHQAGAKFGYIITSGAMPLLDDFLELGIDVLIGVDPVMGKWDFKTLKEKVKGKMCLWGGVNGFLTVERGRNKDVEREVSDAISELGKDNGFILSPVDNVTNETECVWENINTLIKVWKEKRGIYAK